MSEKAKAMMEKLKFNNLQETNKNNDLNNVVN